MASRPRLFLPVEEEWKALLNCSSLNVSLIDVGGYMLHCKLGTGDATVAHSRYADAFDQVKFTTRDQALNAYVTSCGDLPQMFIVRYTGLGASMPTVEAFSAHDEMRCSLHEFVIDAGFAAGAGSPAAVQYGQHLKYSFGCLFASSLVLYRGCGLLCRNFSLENVMLPPVHVARSYFPTTGVPVFPKMADLSGGTVGAPEGRTIFDNIKDLVACAAPEMVEGTVYDDKAELWSKGYMGLEAAHLYTAARRQQTALEPDGRPVAVLGRYKNSLRAYFDQVAAGVQVNTGQFSPAWRKTLQQYGGDTGVLFGLLALSKDVDELVYGDLLGVEDDVTPGRLFQPQSKPGMLGMVPMRWIYLGPLLLFWPRFLLGEEVWAQQEPEVRDSGLASPDMQPLLRLLLDFVDPATPANLAFGRWLFRYCHCCFLGVPEKATCQEFDSSGAVQKLEMDFQALKWTDEERSRLDGIWAAAKQLLKRSIGCNERGQQGLGDGLCTILAELLPFDHFIPTELLADCLQWRPENRPNPLNALDRQANFIQRTERDDPACHGWLQPVREAVVQFTAAGVRHQFEEFLKASGVRKELSPLISTAISSAVPQQLLTGISKLAEDLSKKGRLQFVLNREGLSRPPDQEEQGVASRTPGVVTGSLADACFSNMPPVPVMLGTQSQAAEELELLGAVKGRLVEIVKEGLYGLGDDDTASFHTARSMDIDEQEFQDLMAQAEDQEMSDVGQILSSSRGTTSGRATSSQSMAAEAAAALHELPAKSSLDVYRKASEEVSQLGMTPAGQALAKELAKVVRHKLPGVMEKMKRVWGRVSGTLRHRNHDVQRHTVEELQQHIWKIYENKKGTVQEQADMHNVVRQAIKCLTEAAHQDLSQLLQLPLQAMPQSPGVRRSLLQKAKRLVLRKG